MQSPQWDKLHFYWVTPAKCACCNKCWLVTNEQGLPIIIYDKMGNAKTRCIHGGPYLGYVEVPDPT